MSFNVGTLSPAQREEIVKGQEPDLSGYMARTVVPEPAFPITRREGAYRKLGQNRTHASDGEGRSTKQRPGSPTPEGSGGVKSLSYVCEHYKFKEGIDELTGMELETAIPIYSQLGLEATHEVLADFERDFIEVVKGNGTDDSEDSILTMTLSSGQEFDDTTGSPITQIQKALRSIGSGARAVLGFDVAFALMRHPDVIGATEGGSKSDNTMVALQSLLGFFQSRFGVGQVYVGTQPIHDGAENWDFQRSYLHDGACYFDDGKNLERPTFMDLRLDDYEDRDKEMKYVRARFDADIVRRFKENSIALKNVLANPGAI